ncbi:MAG: bifunctional diaminohydroxyphosphoribosylaminopyrimidine deaminase/5-amino-6-(5-phosphoribosylamino)uracil reductase RibD [Cyclobacteriaceae bacterium]
MQRALELAQNGKGWVSPNPLVGCVIVHEGNIVGEGYHWQYGGPHAEVNAINSVDDKSILPESTVYVTLEPCAHFGKTPPCADLLIENRVKKVVICNEDPNPKVSGQGIERMRTSGIEVSIGIQKEVGRFVNRRFFTSFENKRPYVMLKWAQTSDGFVARSNFDSKWISNAYSRQLVHQWRAEEDAIMVGTNTAFYDNPSLTVRDWVGKDPIRVVIDRDLRLEKDLKLFDGNTQTICITEKNAKDQKNLAYLTVDRISAKTVLEILHAHEIQSVFIEGGARLLQEFITENLWDEARIFTSDVCFGDGIFAPKISGKTILNRDIFGDRLEYIMNK